MEKKAKGLARGGKTTSYKHIPRLTVEPAGLKRHVSPPLAPQLEASTSGAVPQGQGPLADTTATVNVRGESAAADTSGELGANGYNVKMPHPPKSNFRFATLQSRRSTAATGTSLMRSWRSVLRPATTA